MDTLQPAPLLRKRSSTTYLQSDSQKRLQQPKEDKEILLQPDDNLQSYDKELKQFKIERRERLQRRENRVRSKWCLDCKMRMSDIGSEYRLCRLCIPREKEERENGPSCLTIRSVELFNS